MRDVFCLFCGAKFVVSAKWRQRRSQTLIASPFLLLLLVGLIFSCSLGVALNPPGLFSLFSLCSLLSLFLGQQTACCCCARLSSPPTASPTLDSSSRAIFFLLFFFFFPFHIPSLFFSLRCRGTQRGTAGTAVVSSAALQNNLCGERRLAEQLTLEPFQRGVRRLSILGGQQRREQSVDQS